MAARSFSSPQGELEMHRLRRALERVSFDQTLGGRLDESDGETKPPSQGTLSCRSLTDSSKILLRKPGLGFLFSLHQISVPHFLILTLRWSPVPRLPPGLGQLHRPRVPFHCCSPGGPPSWSVPLTHSRPSEWQARVLGGHC